MEMIQGKMEIAVKYGADVAILLHNMVYWVEKNQANGVNFRDGRYWTYNSMDALCAMYPLWSRDQIKRLLKRCCELGLLYSGEYNKDRRDRTRWYSPSEEVMALYQIRPDSIGRNRQMQSADLPENGAEQSIGQNRQMHVAESPGADGEIAPPLPRRDQEETKEPPLPPEGAKRRRVRKYELQEDAKPVLRSYVGTDQELARALASLIDIRKDKQAINSRAAITRLLRKLDELSQGNRDVKLALIDQSIENSWKSVFPLKGTGPGRPAAAPEVRYGVR